MENETSQESEAYENVAREVISEINNYESDSTSVARNVGVAIFTYASKLKEAHQRKLIKTIKGSKELKLSPQFVYDCYRMIKKFPEMASASWTMLPNLSLSHYFEAARYKVSNQGILAYIQEASDFSHSIREMKDNISKDLKQNYTVSEKEKVDLKKEVHRLVNKLDVPHLKRLKIKCDEYIAEQERPK